MVTGLYAALAASASIFIGILTALLVNNLSNLKSERNLIERRIESIESRIQGLEQEKDNIEEYASKIEEPRFTKKASLSPEYQHRNPADSMVSADKMAEVQSVRQHNQRHHRWNRTRAQIESLYGERDKFVDRHESLDLSNVVSTLYASIVTIVLSVAVPLFAYLLHVSSTLPSTEPLWLEPRRDFRYLGCGAGLRFLPPRSTNRLREKRSRMTQSQY